MVIKILYCGFLSLTITLLSSELEKKFAHNNHCKGTFWLSKTSQYKI